MARIRILELSNGKVALKKGWFMPLYLYRFPLTGGVGWALSLEGEETQFADRKHALQTLEKHYPTVIKSLTLTRTTNGQ